MRYGCGTSATLMFRISFWGIISVSIVVPSTYCRPLNMMAGFLIDPRFWTDRIEMHGLLITLRFGLGIPA